MTNSFKYLVLFVYIVFHKVQWIVYKHWQFLYWQEQDVGQKAGQKDESKPIRWDKMKSVKSVRWILFTTFKINSSNLNLWSHFWLHFTIGFVTVQVVVANINEIIIKDPHHSLGITVNKSQYSIKTCDHWKPNILSHISTDIRPYILLLLPL